MATDGEGWEMGKPERMAGLSEGKERSRRKQHEGKVLDSMARAGAAEVQRRGSQGAPEVGRGEEGVSLEGFERGKGRKRQGEVSRQVM